MTNTTIFIMITAAGILGLMVGAILSLQPQQVRAEHSDIMPIAMFISNATSLPVKAMRLVFKMTQPVILTATLTPTEETKFSRSAIVTR